MCYLTSTFNCLALQIQNSHMSVEIKISINDGIYLKDPQESALGRNILKYSIVLIEKIGFEAFNFKKLSQEMSSTEASVYRYFENKHTLLLYLVSWYWGWVSYLITINTKNIEDPKRKLQIIIHSFVSASIENPNTDYIDEHKLHSIIIAEGNKSYRTKGVDKEYEKRFFRNYEQLITSVANVILEINPKFEFPYALATSLFEMSNDHLYFAKHLPRLTDINKEKNKYREVEVMLNYFATKLLD